MSKPYAIFSAILLGVTAAFILPLSSHFIESSRATCIYLTNDSGGLDHFVGEVVGHRGRIGSFLLRAGNGTFAAVLRNDSPGKASPPNSPIYVAVPATEVPSVVLNTVPSRRRDLVMVTNGIPSDFYNQVQNSSDGDVDIEGMTTTVPHFGILSQNSDPISDPSSPPTFIHGRHASKLADILTQFDVKVTILNTLMQIDVAAVRKLLWVSMLWLLCHDTEEMDPIDVIRVHETKEDLFRKLVEELLPVAISLFQFYHPDCHTKQMGSVESIYKYLHSYSYSMPGAIPNKQLAIEEMGQRNALLLERPFRQPLHRNLVERVCAGNK